MKGCEMTRKATVVLTQPPWETALEILIRMLVEGATEVPVGELIRVEQRYDPPHHAEKLCAVLLPTQSSGRTAGQSAGGWKGKAWKG